MKVVIDTNVLISSFFSSGSPSHKIISYWKKGRITLCATYNILEEYIGVLARFEIKENQLREFFGLINRKENILFVVPDITVKIIKADPTDNMFLECALAAKAEFIISGDKHLLDLKKYKKIKIVSPSEFLTLFN